MRRILFGLLAATFLVVAPASPAGAQPNVPDPAQMGPYEVGFTNFLLIDPSRDGDGDLYDHRPIPVYVWYPVDPETITGSTPQAIYPFDPIYDGAGILPVLSSTSSDWEPYGIDRAYQEPAVSADGPFPLLVFSPGWGFEPWGHISIGTRLASHGFVVAVLYHHGDCWWSWEPCDHLAVCSFNRPLDVSFALTDLLAKNETEGHLLFGAIRPEQVAAGGWSLGGYAAMALSGGDDSVCDTLYGAFPEDPPAWTCAPSLVDPRIRAIVALDGSNQLLHFDELARITVPAMGLGEEWEMLALPPPGSESWQARQHAAFSGHPAYRVDVFNSIHQSFSDLCELLYVEYYLFSLPDWWLQGNLEAVCTPFTPTIEVHRLVNQYLIAFLKTNLAGEQGYQSMLTPGWALGNEPLIEFFVTERRNPHSIDDDWPDNFIYFMHQPGSAQAVGPKDPDFLVPVLRHRNPQ
ncbi:MAG: putative dienelactone hydrolase [Acidobacteria bacterium]|nr:putative dienelactone hydrolase [Acidobacteriota bacterium]